MRRVSSKSAFNRWETQNPNSWFSCVPGKNGFMPVGVPLQKLPEKYSKVNELLDDMVSYKKDGTYGHLYHRTFGDKVFNELPLYTKEIEKEKDTQILAALQRDYCVLSSAFSLETAHPKEGSNKYGKAREHLPQTLAEPLLTISKKNNVFPWLDYAYGYALNNSILKSKFAVDTTDYQSWDTARQFIGTKSEKGFITIHTAMVAQTPDLLQEQQNCLEHIYNNERELFNDSLENHYNIFANITKTLNNMWVASNPKDYLTFRTFIYGQTGNQICYPNENIKFMLNDDKYEIHSYRGETGAQDSIVPSIDNFLEVNYPENKLTEYLLDLRQYRPIDHQMYLDYLKKQSYNLKFKEYCYNNSKSCILLLRNLDVLRLFRKKHWSLTKKYIIQNTKHPVATGGTPITTWLPNQLGATLESMYYAVNNINSNELNKSDKQYYNHISIELNDHIQSVMDEVRTMQNEFNAEEQIHVEFEKRSVLYG